jgi:hypothetical protein
MKKLSIVLLLIMLTAKLLNAQDDFDFVVKHVKGIKSVNGTFNLGFHSIGGELGMNYFFSDQWIGEVNLSTDFGNIDYTDFGYYKLNLGMHYTVFKLTDNVYVNAKLMGKVGFEDLKSQVTDQTENNLLLGFSLGINAEIYLYKAVGLNIHIDQIPYITSNLGKQYINFGIGIKYFIY